MRNPLSREVFFMASAALLLLSVPAGLAISSAAQTGSTANSPVLGRDPRALEILQRSAVAIGISDSNPLSDYQIEGTIETVQPRQSRGTISMRGIGTEYVSVAWKLDDGTHVITTRHGAGAEIHPGASSTTVSASNGFQSGVWFPLPTLIDAISDPSVGLEYLGRGPTGDGDERIRLTHHSSTWRPHTDAQDTAVLDLYINFDSGLIDVIQIDAHLTSDLSHTKRGFLTYSDYRLEHGWMIPHHVEENYVDGQAKTIALNSFVFNQGLNVSSFVTR